MENEGETYGFLQMCADKRFHAEVELKFQELTGLQPHEYWIEASAGGAPGITSSVTADYAYTHGARMMGWAAHGDSCGGFPGVSTEEMQKKLDEKIQEMKKKYPDATHFRLFSTNGGTIGQTV